MNLSIELPDDAAAILGQQAAAQGVSLEEFIRQLACERALGEPTVDQQKAQAAVSRIVEIQKRVKPDPEGWTIRDYIRCNVSRSCCS